MTRTKGKPPGRSKAVRYAVVGLGHIAQAAVLPAFSHSRRNSRLAALVSGERKKLDALGRLELEQVGMISHHTLHARRFRRSDQRFLPCVRSVLPTITHHVHETSNQLELTLHRIVLEARNSREHVAHAAAKVRVMEESGKFVRIRLPNNLEGWTEHDGVVEL